jgi:hypothetical protein
VSPVDIERASSICLSPPPGKMAGILGDGACGLALRALARPLLHGETVVASPRHSIFFIPDFEPAK